MPILLSVLSISPTVIHAQDRRLVDGEMTTCRLTVYRPASSGKANTHASNRKQTAPLQEVIFTPELNQMGYFDQVADIKPNETVQVELSYPEGRTGEQIVVSVEDGGLLNKEQRVGVYHLDHAKKISFSFTVNESHGLYRLAARKEFETRLVQLWVGAEPAPVRGAHTGSQD